MARIQTKALIRELIEASSRKDNYTYRQLAEHVYGSKEPTPSQLAHVRRSVGQLVAEGIVEKRRDDAPGYFTGTAQRHTRMRRVIVDEDTWTDKRGRKISVRRYATKPVQAYNPAGTLVGRPWTDEDYIEANKALAELEKGLSK